MQAALSINPDSPGIISISVAYGPAYPLALGRIECAADLDVTVRLRMQSETKALHMLQLDFEGKSLDLLTVLMRVREWEAKFPAISAMSEEEYRARDAVPATSGPSIGTDQPSI